jgi:heme-degrading monooxygenase HmoA
MVVFQQTKRRHIASLQTVEQYLITKSVPGNQSVHILERQEGEITTHFITLTFWDSLDAIRGFAGEDVERAKYYPEDSDFLLEFEPKVVHYEVVGQSRSE